MRLGCNYDKDHPRHGLRPAYHNPHAEGWASITRKYNAFGAKEGSGRHSAGHKGHGSSTTPPTVIADAPNRVRRWISRSTSPPTGGRSRSAQSSTSITRGCLGATVKRSITGEHLIGDLRRLAIGRDTLPPVPPCDKGDELACRPALLPPCGRLGHHGMLDPVLHHVPAAAASSTGSKAGVGGHRNTVEHSIRLRCD